jgi:hypothetical protein
MGFKPRLYINEDADFELSSVQTDGTAGSGAGFGGNPKIIQVGSTATLKVGMKVTGHAKIPANSVITQIDSATLFRINNDVVFSFILFQSTPQFDNVFIEPSYIYSIIENAQAIHYEYDGNKFPVFIPSKVDTLVWKYIEYLDKYEYMPNSYEHYSSIINKLSSQRISFFDKIDIYVKRKPEDYDSVSTNLVFKKRLTVTQIKRLIKKMPSPFAEVLLFVANKTYKLYHGRN